MKTFFLNDFLDEQHDKKILSKIHEINIQSTYTWTDPERIYEIFKILCGSIKPHSFLTPDGRDIFLEVVDLTEDLCIDLISTCRHRFRIKSLSYKPIKGGDSYYFLLETSVSKPTGLCESYLMNPFSEIVTEIEPGNYYNHNVYDSYDPEIDHFPVRPCLVRRYFSGSVLILSNDNPYRQTQFSCEGLHTWISREELTDIMESFYRTPGKAIL